MQKLIRQLHPETRVVDQARGTVEYTASDETIDSFQEVIRASGWRFTHFKKNSPFVDSHDTRSINKLVGKVVAFQVRGARLIERVQWAIGIGNTLADLGFEMTKGGFLKAVSVGFFPVKVLRPTDGAAYRDQLRELGLPQDTMLRAIYAEQEQVELSSVIIGANPNALLKARSAGVLTEPELRFLQSRGQGDLHRRMSVRIPFPEVLPENQNAPSAERDAGPLF